MQAHTPVHIRYLTSYPFVRTAIHSLTASKNRKIQFGLVLPLQQSLVLAHQEVFPAMMGAIWCTLSHTKKLSKRFRQRFFGWYCSPSPIFSTQSLASSAVSACRTSVKFENRRWKMVGSCVSLYSTFSMLINGKLRFTFTYY